MKSGRLTKKNCVKVQVGRSGIDSVVVSYVNKQMISLHNLDTTVMYVMMRGDAGGGESIIGPLRNDGMMEGSEFIGMCIYQHHMLERMSEAEKAGGVDDEMKEPAGATMSEDEEGGVGGLVSSSSGVGEDEVGDLFSWLGFSLERLENIHVKEDRSFATGTMLPFGLVDAHFKVWWSARGGTMHGQKQEKMMILRFARINRQQFAATGDFAAF